MQNLLFSSSPFISSSIGILRVFGYTPTEGEQGVPITVHLHFIHDRHDTAHVRLVIASTPIATNVREINVDGYTTWQLEGSVPPFRRSSFRSLTVPLRVEAFDRDWNLLDAVTFGEFMYWESGKTPFHFHFPTHPYSIFIPECFCPQQSHSSQREDPFPAVPSQSPLPPRVLSSQRDSPKLHRRAKARAALKRTRAVGTGEVLAALDFVTPLAELCHGWDPSEIKAGRRLVRFWSVQERHRLIVSCERISQEQYRSTDTVVSCIYRDEVNDCFITSVDIIYLLQKLVGEEFAVMEKNRIRRNLEGLRPTTVSKHRPGVGSFFQRIMDFPEPKPRNIEKDLKVFPWTSLDQALEKIISKYVSCSRYPPHLTTLLTLFFCAAAQSLTTDQNWQFNSPPLPVQPISVEVAAPAPPQPPPYDDMFLSYEKDDLKPSITTADPLDLVYYPIDLSALSSPTEFIDPTAVSGPEANTFMYEKDDSKPSITTADPLDLVYPPIDISALSSPTEFIDPTAVNGPEANPFMFASPALWEENRLKFSDKCD